MPTDDIALLLHANTPLMEDVAGKRRELEVTISRRIAQSLHAEGATKKFLGVGNVGGPSPNAKR